MAAESDDAGRAFVLGLDGVPWSLLSEWAAAGTLPNVARLFETGATGPLESTSPATTPVAWPSIFTGVGPDKHGIYAFHGLTAAHTRELNTNATIDQPKLWDLLAPAQVLNVPMTYPATEMDGRFVAGMMAPSMDGQFTHPPELVDEIRAAVPDYEVGLDWFDYHGDLPALTDDLDDLVAARRALLAHLMETAGDWRLFFAVFTAPDRLQHLCWDEAVLREFYATLDDVLGEVMDFVDAHDATLYVVSDHGFGPLERFVYPNTVLAEAGLLTPRSTGSVRGVLDRVGVSRDGVRAALDRVGLNEDRLLSVLPESVVHRAGRQLPGDHPLYDVDFAETRAFVTALGTVYVNDARRFDDGVVAPEEVPAVKRAVREAMTAVRDPATGDPVFAVHDGDDLYPADEDSPDLKLDALGPTKVKTTLGDQVFDDTGVYAGDHRPEGIVLAWGADVDPGARITGAHVTDVAPTVLHGAGEPVPDHVDGTVLTDVFAPGSTPATTAVRTGTGSAVGGGGDDAAAEDFDGVEERLKGLGYME